MRLADPVDYVRSHTSATAVPIHDGRLNEAGKQLTDTVMTALLGGDRYRRLNSGESLSITADQLGSRHQTVQIRTSPASTGDGRSDHPGHSQGRRRLANGAVRNAEIERCAPARKCTRLRTCAADR
jgi:hypothetical protein